MLRDRGDSLPVEAAATPIRQAIAWAEQELTSHAVESPRRQAELLLGHLIGFSRARILAHPTEPLQPDTIAEFRELIARRAAREPCQYILGRSRFLDFELRVQPGVFIPRPETEQVVEAALALWDFDPPWAIDACTGSGAIAIALARARPKARVLAIDVAPLPLAVAHTNASELGVDDRVFFVRGDLLMPLALSRGRSSVGASSGGRSDQPSTPETVAGVGVLVCNPPYAPLRDVTQPEVRDHEPPLAWAAGPKGTEVFERLIPEAATILAPGCSIVLELGVGQSNAVRGLLTSHGGWQEIRVSPDFQNIPRVLTARRS